MEQARKPKRLRPRAKSFLDCLRYFVTPQVWMQAQQAGARRRKMPRWSTQPLLFVLLTLTWCYGDSLEERFEIARAYYVASHQRRRRPGKTVQGFRKALAKLDRPTIRAFADALRRQVAKKLAAVMELDGFVPLGCDGSRLECPRSAELEQRLRWAGKKQKRKRKGQQKKDTAPTIWLTALVLLRTGVPWAWRLGASKPSETAHLQQMLPTLPPKALVVGDALYMGYELASNIMATQAAFLFRLSSKNDLYTASDIALPRFREGIVYYWPKYAQQQNLPPLKLRLLRVRGKKTKHDVWLLTNVLESSRLSLKTAAWFYRLRWESEGFFRTFKRTLSKVKLASRTVKLVTREAEGSLLAVQLLLAQGALALAPLASDSGEAEPMSSPRKVLLEVRREILACIQVRLGGDYLERLSQAKRERRQRRSQKTKREWSRRREHKPPAPPNLLRLTDEQEALVLQLEDAA